ncbi:hypothetical protein I4641_23435 [Waterburya agarophytonicola K14]|uniref:Uncharacterized protein n=1 Tax=Waterburya agarophytonicola KI4 TaxID=2874699 RepID=A0A964FMK6_9CYAN|nr:hypothetical protein [Waterburya agarophytonicola]MCC0179893.1 hypothetical protein [Waterburya agarophytonicola KI4]
MSPWVQDPNSGGVKITEKVRERVKQRILNYAETNYSGKYIRLDVRFRGQFCYIDAYKEPDIAADFPPPDFPESREEYLERRRNNPIHLCRLRYFGNEAGWGFAFYSYSSEKYKLSVFDNGEFYGTPEEAFESSAMYLQD